MRFHSGDTDIMKDIVAEERMLRVELAGDVSFDVMISPHDIHSFIMGHLFCEGFIKDLHEIEDYGETERNGVVHVSLRIKDFDTKINLLHRNYNIIWTECGSGSARQRMDLLSSSAEPNESQGKEVKRVGDSFDRFVNSFKIRASDLIRIPDRIRGSTDLFRQTGAFHYAFLFDKEIKITDFAFDIGRHNAVDKVIGKALKGGIGFDDKVLFITGRITSDIVMKCLRSRIRLIVTRGAPLDKAIVLSRKYNMGLVGFLRGKRFNVYSGKDMIEYDR